MNEASPILGTRIPGERSRGPETPDQIFGLDTILPILRRQLRVIVVAIAFVLIIAAIYLLTAVPRYSASTLLLIDGSRTQDQAAATIAELTFDSGAIDSQIEVLKSTNVAAGVVSALQLDKDPEFSSNETGILGAALIALRRVADFPGWFVSQEVAQEEAGNEARQNALYKLAHNLQVVRIGHTSVLDITFQSPDPQKAANISNAFAQAYFDDQLQAKFEATKRASGWLQDRIDELKRQSVDSDLAVQRFMSQNGLIAADGKFVADQQLTEMTTQLSQAHNDTARAEARLAQIQSAIKAGRIDASVGESLDNPVVNDLRTKFLTASKSEAELRQKLGPSHYQVQNLQKDMAQYERLIFDELQRVAQTYSADLDVARAKEKSLNESMAALLGQKSISDETMVHLRQLEQEARSFKSLYQTFLRRYQDTVQRISFPSSEARIISSADVPSSPSSPKTVLILALALVVGCLLGGALAAYRESRDRVFRSIVQIRDDLGLNLIGMVKQLRDKAVAFDTKSFDPSKVMIKNSIMTYVDENPLSSFAEVLRGAKVEADLAMKQKRCHVIGIISVQPGEGKTTIAKNFASLLAAQGAKTLLIDGDLRNNDLTRKIAPHATRGLLEVLNNEATIEDCVVTEENSSLLFLPAVIKKRLSNSAELLSSEKMRRMLLEVQEHLDYVVVDLAPLGPVIDVRAAADLFDGFLLVIKWGVTPRNLVKNAVSDDPLIYNRCFGVILNKTDKKRMRLYQNEGYRDYYYRQYGNYYLEGPQKKRGKKTESAL